MVYISHSKRICQATPPSDRVYAAEVEVKRTKTLVDGRLNVHTELETIEPSDRMKGFHTSDFSLDSIIQTGSVSLLKESVISRHDVFKVLDSIPEPPQVAALASPISAPVNKDVVSAPSENAKSE